MLFTKLPNYTQFLSLSESHFPCPRKNLCTTNLMFTCPVPSGTLPSSGDCKVQLHRTHLLLKWASVLAFPASSQETLRAVEAQDNRCGLLELISNLSLSLSRWEWQDFFGKNHVVQKAQILISCSLNLFLHFLSVFWDFIAVSQVSSWSFLGLILSIYPCVFCHGGPILPSVAAQGKAEKIS